MPAKLWCILRAPSVSFMNPVLVGALWWVRSAGLTFRDVATRRGEGAWLTRAGTTGSCCSATARAGCGGAVNVVADADATVAEWLLSVEVVK